MNQLESFFAAPPYADWTFSKRSASARSLTRIFASYAGSP